MGAALGSSLLPHSASRGDAQSKKEKLELNDVLSKELNDWAWSSEVNGRSHEIPFTEENLKDTLRQRRPTVSPTRRSGALSSAARCMQMAGVIWAPL